MKPLHKDLIDQLKYKTLIFDGGMGTMLMGAGQASARSPVLLNVEQPDLVADIHRRYYEAGADVVIANTFGGNPLKLAAEPAGRGTGPSSLPGGKVRGRRHRTERQNAHAPWRHPAGGHGA
jgi:hypothetical protein